MQFCGVTICCRDAGLSRLHAQAGERKAERMARRRLVITLVGITVAAAGCGGVSSSQSGSGSSSVHGRSGSTANGNSSASTAPGHPTGSGSTRHGRPTVRGSTASGHPTGSGSTGHDPVSPSSPLAAALPTTGAGSGSATSTTAPAGAGATPSGGASPDPSAGYMDAGPGVIRYSIGQTGRLWDPDESVPYATITVSAPTFSTSDSDGDTPQYGYFATFTVTTTDIAPGREPGRIRSGLGRLLRPGA